MDMLEFNKNVITGLSVMGSTNIEAITLILTNHYDLQLKCVAFNVFHKNTFNPSDEDLNTPLILEAVERIKFRYRMLIQDILHEAGKMDEQEAKELQKKRMKELHAQSEFGTVAEICTKYGFTKSEVRRMRADGTLSANIMAKTAIGD